MSDNHKHTHSPTQLQLDLINAFWVNGNMVREMIAESNFNQCLAT